MFKKRYFPLWFVLGFQRIFKLLFSVEDASSANNVCFISTLYIFMPFISGLFVMLFVQSSRHMIRRYGDKGHPCLTPLFIWKNSEKKPLLEMHDLASVLFYKNTLFVTNACNSFYNVNLFSILNILQYLWLIIRVYIQT